MNTFMLVCFSVGHCKNLAVSLISSLVFISKTLIYAQRQVPKLCWLNYG